MAAADYEFEAREDRLEQEECARYGNANNEQFTTLYYPQSRYDYLSKATKISSGMDYAVLQNARCSKCNGKVDYTTFRRFRGDSEYCLNCLKVMGCCILPGSDNVLFPDLIAMIMSFLPEYFHATRAARVSKLWLSCFNFDHTHESDLMALKRDWISREIFFRSRAVLSPEGVARLETFTARFDLGALLGDWMDNSFKTRYHWLRLCCSIAESSFYAAEYGILRSRMSGNPTYTEGANYFAMCVPVSAKDSLKCNVYRIPLVLKSGGTIQTALADADASFSAVVHTKEGKTIDITFDPRNGTLVGPEHLAVTKKKAWQRCLFC
ncbi:Hypothetical protein, putative [Bodo saltans]|uniref:Uncharacterized protein n=1 Tax=Bodo saltans TaxID=75058 RepID=A0A0S4JCW2_BODSA|nr:Hypothetical protein, putative [Bodo saltans]|eukprot:CUG86140.1 Hypothetical protein, putative [Bodo saltans]